MEATCITASQDKPVWGPCARSPFSYTLLQRVIDPDMSLMWHGCGCRQPTTTCGEPVLGMTPQSWCHVECQTHVNMSILLFNYILRWC